MHLPLFSSLRNRGTLALLIKIAPLMRVAAPVPNPVSVSSLSTAPAPMSTQLWDTAHDREAERDVAHAVYNTLHAFHNWENSVDFSMGTATVQQYPLLTYHK